MKRFTITRNKFATDESFATKANAMMRAESLATSYPEFRWEVRDTKTGKATIAYPYPEEDKPPTKDSTMQATTTKPYVNRHFDKYQLSDAQLYRIFRYRGKRIAALKPAQSAKTKPINHSADLSIAQIRDSGAPGSESRIAALSAYYAAEMAQNDNAKSAFLA